MLEKIFSYNINLIITTAKFRFPPLSDVNKRTFHVKNHPKVLFTSNVCYIQINFITFAGIRYKVR